MRWQTVFVVSCWAGISAGKYTEKTADQGCRSCPRQTSTSAKRYIKDQLQLQGDRCSETTPAPRLKLPALAAAVTLGERGYCLAGDYDTILGRLPLFNSSIKDPSKCISYLDSDSIERSFRPPMNFLKYHHFESALSSPGSFSFRIVNVYPSLWDAYTDFRRRSSIVVDALTTYEDLFATLSNIGAGKQSIFQSYYKKFQRSVLDKRVPFYHLRAEIIHGEFEMRKPDINESNTYFSTPFLNYFQQQLLNRSDENGTGTPWDEKFFMWFGTHYVRRGFFGGYIDLMIAPWDITCETPVSANLSMFARCIRVKLNKKFGLGSSRNPNIDDKEHAACAGLTFWMQSDQDIFTVVSGSDYDYQTAMSIGVRYPIYKDASDKPLMRAWLYSLYDAPGLVEATVEPICEIFPNEAVALKTACKKHLLKYMKSNEPFLRTWVDDALVECEGGKRLVFDIGFNVLREGCVWSTRSPGLCPRENRTSSNAATDAKNCVISVGGLFLILGPFHEALRRWMSFQ